MTCSDYISVTNTRATARVACVQEKKTNHPRRNEQTYKLNYNTWLQKGLNWGTLSLAFGSRRLDQFDVFMSPRATVNSQPVYATDGDAHRCVNLVMLTWQATCKMSGPPPDGLGYRFERGWGTWWAVSCSQGVKIAMTAQWRSNWKRNEQQLSNAAVL